MVVAKNAGIEVVFGVFNPNVFEVLGGFLVFWTMDGIGQDVSDGG